ncbi:MAG: VOC family protein [Giesbergeria sp.]|jgi:PhnB protein|nr:VOC family protein [Giesbergeria sp.]
MQVQPYLFFDGRCEEALNFYSAALGAQVTALMRFKDAPPSASAPGCTPPPGDKIMHANLQIGPVQIMASDGMVPGEGAFKGFALSLAPATDAEAACLFQALAEGGQVQMPLGPTFFASSFAMLTDRFGVPWMLVVPLPEPAPARPPSA